MELKVYQSMVIERFDDYLATLREKRGEATEFYEFQKSKGRDATLHNYPADAWEALNQQRLLPRIRDKTGAEHDQPYVSREDGMDRPIPNVCFKVPTAGGKTLLATASIEKLCVDYFRRQTGFVLWVVPSDAIYRQTWKSLADREHPYRQMLERASGGRVKMLERTDRFTRQDSEQYLCVMVLMLQAAGRQSKETLRMFRDSGGFTSFFPEVDDYSRNNALLNEVRNLDVNDLGDAGAGVIQGISVKHSLSNVLRLLRPIIVIDEGHRAYSETARSTLTGFNPSFVLELSATPNARKHISNILVDIPGTALKDEQMVKLPINLQFENGDWKDTLTAASTELESIEKAARDFQKTAGRYIRPINLIRVDRTGREQQDGLHVHAEDARKYLIDNLGVPEDQIRIKSATVDELRDDDLLSEFCPVRYIITKDALREGWDCPFAYVLTILSATTAKTALTQMIGRVLRQPDTRSTGVESLDECRVFTFDRDVKDAVESVKRGLEQEGMGDIAEEIKTVGQDAEAEKPVRVKRKAKWKGLKVFLPRVLHQDGANALRLLDYDRDILGELDWDRFSFTKRFKADDPEWERMVVSLNVESRQGQFELSRTDTLLERDGAGEIDFTFMVRHLMDVVPNPWQAARIMDEVLTDLGKEVPKERLFANRLHLLQSVRKDLRAQVEAAAEDLFREKLSKGKIAFRLVSPLDERPNWELAETLELRERESDKVLRDSHDQDLKRAMFEKIYELDVNGLERRVAWYLDDNDAVKWWHRLASRARSEYHLQGWQRNRVFPDFLVALTDLEDGTRRIVVLETKGEQLKGNDDTEYKRKLMDLLSESYRRALEVGEVELIDGQKQAMIFRMLMEDSWQTELASSLQEVSA
jgi:type III restriction enzyme